MARLVLVALLSLCGLLPGLDARGQVPNPLMDDSGRSHKPSSRAAGKVVGLLFLPHCRIYTVKI